MSMYYDEMRQPFSVFAVNTLVAQGIGQARQLLKDLGYSLEHFGNCVEVYRGDRLVAEGINGVIELLYDLGYDIRWQEDA